MKIKLTTYIDKIEAKYINARKEWEKLQEKITEENNHWNSIKWNELSQLGVTNERARHIEKLESVNIELEALREKFGKSVEAIKEDANKIFDKKYSFTAGTVDQNGVTLLQSGALGSDDIIRIANEYYDQGNYTMYFLCVDKLKNSFSHNNEHDPVEKRASSFLGMANQRRKREDHEVVEEFEYVCMSGLRNEDYLSEGVHRLHDDFLAKARAQADKIEVITESPWD